jgi:tetratricopeptide (TPR) repeat protein
MASAGSMITTSDFTGTARFEVLRRVGVGGCGVVYEVFDKERGARAALKTLVHLEPEALYRFKKEFRTLSDARHPNLVQLRELATEGDLWFLTMEFVDGVDFSAYVRPSDEEIAPDPSTIPLAGDVGTATPLPSRRGGTLDVELLRSALKQLATGVAALHARSLLHRDLKPSNVLVRHDGRVVIVDFGLATEIGGDASVTARGAIGTPAYMAPEQAAGAPATQASDWYAVGVMLYRALTGALPFAGTPHDVMMAKQSREATPPQTIAEGIPEDLATLCMHLLRRDPGARPTGAELLRRLGAEPTTHSSSRPSTTEGPPFVGRADALATLRSAFDRTRRGEPAMVLIEGTSGLGKTALVRRFLDETTIVRQTVVLSGRCYEREAVPYKGFDTIVDSLCVWLLRASSAEVDALLPRDVAVLARVFPVLQRVPAIATAPRRPLTGAHPQQLRSRAFSALRELLARLADRRPLILFVDDLQWGDGDSAALLAEIAMDPSGPTMLTLVAHRSGEDSIALRALRSAPETPITISLDALDEAQVRILARALMGSKATDARVDRIAAESAGNPLFVAELVRHAEQNEDLQSLRLETVLASRVGALAAPARRLLEVLATFGGPVELGTAARAAELERAEATTAADDLRAANLARTSGREDRIEPYHDRVRETVTTLLDAEATKALHGRIAQALLTTGNADPEALLTHAQAAGFDALAAEYAESAAERAAHQLAFDRAAELYRVALEGSEDPGARRRLTIALAEALANAGRGRESARAYLDALAGGGVREDLDLRRRAGEQYLRSGHVEEGLAVIAALLADVGMRLPATPLRALLTFVVLRAWLSLRGFGFTPGDERDAPADVRQRNEICKTVSEGLAVVDPIRSLPFQTRYTLMSLGIGDPPRIVRALSMEACLASTRGNAGKRRVESLIARAASLAATLKRPETDAHVDAARGSLAFFCGQFTAAHEHWERAMETYRAESVGVWWELDAFRYFGVVGLLMLGDVHEVRRRMPGLLRDAQDRGDLFLETNLRVGEPNMLLLFDDRPQAVRDAVTAAMARWPQRLFHVQHWYALQAFVHADLYEGNGKAAWERMVRGWNALSSSMLLKIEFVRLRAQYLRGRVALMAAREDPSLLGVTSRCARAILSEGVPWAMPLGRLLVAGIENARGRREEAIAALRETIVESEPVGLAIHRRVAEHRLGTMLGGDEGKAMTREATRWLEEQTVRVPDKVVTLFAPGWDAR